MADQVIVQAIEFYGYIGVTDEERQNGQPIAVDVELDYQPGRLSRAAESDDIDKALDYAKVTERIVQLGIQEKYRLLERLADRIAHMLFSEFPIIGLRLWVRKLKAPLKDAHDSVGVRIARTCTDMVFDPAPARFLIDALPFLRRGTVLDVAAGRGRNTLYLAGLGFKVEALDRDEKALQDLADMARQRQLSDVAVQHIDLEAEENPPPFASEQYNECYDAVIVFYYLYRPLFPYLIRALKPGGVLVYETFLIDNHVHYHHPRRKEFCLEHNELLGLARGLRVLHYEEGRHEEIPGCDTHFTARLIAQKG